MRIRNCLAACASVQFYDYRFCGKNHRCRPGVVVGSRVITAVEIWDRMPGRSFRRAGIAERQFGKVWSGRVDRDVQR